MSAPWIYRENSRTVTENLLHLSEENIDTQAPFSPVSDEIRKFQTQKIKFINDLKANNTLRSTTLSFKTNSSFERRKSLNSKRKDFMIDFIQKRQIPLTKVSLRYNRLNMALRDMSQAYNQTCFMSKKLKTPEIPTKTQRKLSLNRNTKQIVNTEVQSQYSFKRVYLNQHQEKKRQLQTMNQVRKKYTFFSKSNKTIL